MLQRNAAQEIATALRGGASPGGAFDLLRPDRIAETQAIVNTLPPKSEWPKARAAHTSRAGPAFIVPA